MMDPIGEPTSQFSYDYVSNEYEGLPRIAWVRSDSVRGADLANGGLDSCYSS